MPTLNLRTHSLAYNPESRVDSEQSRNAHLSNSPDMDDALATLVRVINAHGGKTGLEALSTLLGYMEDLERQVPTTSHTANIVLLEPRTLTI